MTDINFYNVNDEYEEFSNLYISPFTIGYESRGGRNRKEKEESRELFWCDGGGMFDFKTIESEDLFDITICKLHKIVIITKVYHKKHTYSYSIRHLLYKDYRIFIINNIKLIDLFNKPNVENEIIKVLFTFKNNLKIGIGSRSASITREEKDLLEDKSNKVIKVSGIPSIKDDPTSKIILAAQYDDEIYIMGDKSCGYEDSWKIA